MIMATLLFVAGLDTGLVDLGRLRDGGYRCGVRQYAYDFGESLESGGKNNEGTSFRIELLVYKDAEAFKQASEAPIETQSPAPLLRTGFRELPAGVDCFRSRPDETMGANFAIVGNMSIAIGVISFTGKGTPGKVTWIGTDKEGTYDLVEGAVRGTMANYVASFLKPASDQLVEGKRIGGMKNLEGTIYVPLDDWASARGTKITYNRKAGSASFQLGGTTYILALSADQIKDGSEWKKLGGFLVKRGEDWYVPLAGIESAVRY